MPKDTELMRLIRKISFEHELEPSDVIVAFEETIQKAANNKFSKYKDITAVIDKNEGSLRVYIPKKVVRRLKDPETEVLATKVPGVDPETLKTGDMVQIEINPALLDRIAAQTLKNILPQKLQEVKKKKLLSEFHKKIGHLVLGEIQKYDRNNYYVLLGKVIGLISRAEFPPNHTPRIGEKYTFLIVKILENVQGGPYVILSRTRQEFIKRLFEREVPELRESIVELKAVARDIGKRSKIAVISHDKNVDPVGSCVGVAGKRIQEVVKELRGEKIDVVIWNDNIVEFIKNAIHPAEVKLIEIDDEMNNAQVIVRDDHLSLAIGRKGQNAKLAAKLVGYKIDIKGATEFEAAYQKQSQQLKELLKDIEGLTEEEVEVIIHKITYRLEKLADYSAQEIQDRAGVDAKKAEMIIEQVTKQIVK